MSVIQVTMPLQIVCQLLAATQVIQNVTLPSIHNSTSAETTKAPILPFGYVGFPEYGVAYKYFDVGMKQNAARKMCLNEGGQLAVVDSQEKIEKIFEHFRIGEFTWVGLGKSYDDSEWTTIDGKSTSNLPWGSGEPSGDYKCVALGPMSKRLFNFSYNNLHYHLCEIALPRN